MTGERASFEAHVRRASRKLDNALCAYSPPDADSFLDSALAHIRIAKGYAERMSDRDWNAE